MGTTQNVVEVARNQGQPQALPCPSSGSTLLYTLRSMPARGTTTGEKRKRRAASPSHKGLNAGERLNRNRLLVESDIRWNWIGTDVKHASDITQYYQLRADGLIPSKALSICANKFARKVNDFKAREVKEDNVGEDPDNVIVISDEEETTMY